MFDRFMEKLGNRIRRHLIKKHRDQLITTTEGYVLLGRVWYGDVMFADPKTGKLYTADEINAEIP
jgi:hypothetical protein